MDVIMPQLGETVTEGKVTVWRKKVGEPVRADEALFEVSTDKVDTEVPAPASGVLAEILVDEGATVKVGTRLAVISEAAGAKPAARVAAPVAVPPPAAAAARTVKPAAARQPAGARNRDPHGQPLSPVVRRLLDENKLDAGAIAGTGANGRIKRDDVLAFIDVRRKQAFAGGADRVVIPFSKIRKRTAEHMVRSKATSPHVLQAVEVDFSRVEAARREHGAAWRQREGFSLTYLPFVASAVCRAIERFPNVNASVEQDSLVIHKRVHLGIAVDLGADGLIVPVVRDAQALALAALARAIRTASEKARANRLTADDVSGGTYTITNNGSFGTLITAPIINQPQVAVLSMDGVKKRPVVIETPEGDSIAIRPIGILAQSFDHRAVDGAYSAQFLNHMREIIEATDWVSESSK